MIVPSELERISSEFRPLLLECDPSEVDSEVHRWIEAGLAVRIVRGRKMRRLDGLFDEFAAALQFPSYFGENKDAFDECIADLAMIEAGRGYVVVVTDPDQILADVDLDPLRWLIRSLKSATQQWSHPIDLGEWWDRPPLPFHIVLATNAAVAANVVRRWADAGSSPLPLEMS